MFAIDITSEEARADGKELKLQTDILWEASYDPDDSTWSTATPAVGIGLEGEYAKQLTFEASLALEELFKEKFEKVLDTAYITFNWSGAFKLNLGLFKTPFSQEYILSKKVRPYPGHSLGSKKIGPGLDKGVSFTGEELADVFNFEIGLFNGTGQKVADFNNLLATGKSSFSFKFQERFGLDFGYSILYDYASPATGNADYTFGQGGFLKFNGDFSSEKQTLNLFYFVEYLEKRPLALLADNAYNWCFSIFNALALRFNFMEIFSSFELYQSEAQAADPDNEWQLTSGLNFYFYKDMVRLALYCKTENWYVTNTMEQSIASYVYLRF